MEIERVSADDTPTDDEDKFTALVADVQRLETMLRWSEEKRKELSRQADNAHFEATGLRNAFRAVVGRDPKFSDVEPTAKDTPHANP